MPATNQVRILRDTQSKDGWIARTQSHKVCFIHNIGELIQQLTPGQIWEYKEITDRPTYKVIELTTLAAV